MLLPGLWAARGCSVLHSHTGRCTQDTQAGAWHTGGALSTQVGIRHAGGQSARKWCTRHAGGGSAHRRMLRTQAVHTWHTGAHLTHRHMLGTQGGTRHAGDTLDKPALLWAGLENIPMMSCPFWCLYSSAAGKAPNFCPRGSPPPGHRLGRNAPISAAFRLVPQSPA